MINHVHAKKFFFNPGGPPVLKLHFFGGGSRGWLVTGGWPILTWHYSPTLMLSVILFCKELGLATAEATQNPSQACCHPGKGTEADRREAARRLCAAEADQHDPLSAGSGRDRRWLQPHAHPHRRSRGDGSWGGQHQEGHQASPTQRTAGSWFCSCKVALRNYSCCKSHAQTHFCFYKKPPVWIGALGGRQAAKGARGPGCCLAKGCKGRPV